MSKIFISYRRDDNPDAVKLINERLKKLLPSWEIFYDHHSLDLGDRFPDELRQAVTDAEFVLVVIGPRWLELLNERKVASETDYVHEEIRTAFSSESGVIPVAVGNANFPSEADLSGFPEIQSLANLNGKAIRPEPDFDKDIEALVGYLEARGPGVVVGSVLDSKYKLTREVGAGGMGIVYEATQSKPDRRVAVKLIGAGKDTREVIARFDAERQALAMMDHENIAQVYDVGKSYSGRPYFVMEFVNGISITDYCNQERLSIRERLELFRKVCAAVQHAHQKGVLHRDIKPGNVLVTEVDGQATPKVIDFGLAKALGGKLSHHTFFTQIQTAVGTFGYSSPEQAAGKNVDTTTDIYSLGALLYEMLVGAPPFDVEELKSAGEDAMRRHVIDKDPVKPSTKFSSSGAATVDISKQRKIDPTKLQRILKGELDWVIMKALEKDRDRRYGTANDFASDIDRYLNDEAVTARPPSTSYRVNKFVRKNRGLVASVIAIGFLLLAGIIGTSYGLFKANEQAARANEETARANKQTAEAVKQRGIAETKTQEALKEKGKADKERDLAEANERRARKAEETVAIEAKRAQDSEAAAKFQLAVARWDADRVSDAKRLLREIPIDYRKFAWHYVNRLILGSDVTCYGHTRAIACVALSPDGQRIVTGSNDLTLKLWDAESGQEQLTLKGHTDSINSVAFSPDGHRIVSGSDDHTLKLWDAKSGQELQTLKGHTGSVSSVTFSPSGQRIVSVGMNGWLRIWDAKSGQELQTIHCHDKWIRSVAFAPDGQRIVTGCDWNNGYGEMLRLWDAKSGKKLQTFRGQKSPVTSVAFSPDGQRIVCGSEDRMIRLWDAKSGEKMQTLKGHTSSVESVAFSPDGQRLVSGGDQMIKVWNAKNGQELQTLKGHTGSVTSVVFSPDSQRVVSGSWDCTLKLWDAKRGKKQLILEGHTNSVKSVAFSHDGQRIVSGSDDRTLKLWDAKSGQELQTLKGQMEIIGGVTSVAFSPIGQQIAGSTGSELWLWAQKNGPKPQTLKGGAYPVSSMAFSPDGQRIVGGSYDDKLRLWDTQSGNLLQTLKGHTDPVNSVAFSPDSQRIVSGSHDETLKLWDAKTGQELLTLKGHTRRVNSVAFSPDSQRIVSGSDDRTLKLWDAQSGQVLQTLKGHADTVYSVAFSPDSQWIVSGSRDRTIKLWDGKTGEELLTLKGHTDSVYSLAFSPNGQQLISGNGDHTLKLWDARSDNEIQTLKGHRTVRSVAFSQDGQKIYASLGEERWVWDTKTGEVDENATWKDLDRNQSKKFSDGRWLVTYDGIDLLLVDLEFKNTPDEKAYREAKARFDPFWHREQAEKRSNEQDWFAAAFHNSWQLKNEPENAQAISELKNAYSNLAIRFKENERDLEAMLPLVVKQAIKLLPETKPANEEDGDE